MYNFTECELLKKAKRIAVVGLSRNPFKISRMIADYLIRHGYQVVGINPYNNDEFNIPVYKSLIDVPIKIDIVNIFRKSEEIPELITDILKINPRGVWLQQGIKNDSAVAPLIKKGITVIQDRCIKIAHSMCFGE
ncbi:CoA-binding protein [Melioribacter sp. OK-6-Me]|uniref:CoA-binding protein n=1 Tax=unclassified Melioribacter TaxID=2627329 RepID=UPI003ED87656